MLVACGVDDRPPLDECAHGRYWADCGGASNAEPVVGCDPTTGECRWFAGGVTAFGHAVSDCPIEDVCCHRFDGGSWAFSDWTPDEEVRERAGRNMSFFRVAGPITQTTPSGIPVDLAYDGVGVERSRFECEGEVSPTFVSLCAFPDSPGLVNQVDRYGDAVLVTLGDPLFPTFGLIEIEIWPDADGALRARMLQQVGGPMDVPTSALCDLGYGVVMDELRGVLHLSSDDFSDPSNLHGLLEGPGFTLEF